MNKDYDVHPALWITFILVLGLTIAASVSMDKFGFGAGLQLDTTELEMEDLIPGRSDLLQPRVRTTND